MSLEDLKNRIPDYAKDLKLNLSSLLNNPGDMTDEQFWGTMVASAIASRNPEVIREVERDAREKVDEVTIVAAKTASALMGMNNIYYRFIHLVAEKEYGKMPASLRMNGLRSHGAKQSDFELWSLAVSAINGCGACIDSHEKAVAKEGVSRTVIQQSVRIASVIHAIAVVLDEVEAGA
jgi:alkyl hydroperoxide reductase subunit D